MAKYKKNYEAKTKEKTADTLVNDFPDLPDDAKKKLEQIKVKLDKFKEKILGKFEEHVLGIALLPPSKEEDKKEKINVFVLIDDSDSTKMTKEELKEKVTSVIKDMAKETDESLNPDTVILTELWQNCYDAKYDLLQLIATSAPIYDKGMLAAIKISEIHKEMVLKKFEKYIVSYVLVGSLVQGKATPESDIDVFVVIDDTDVKKMSRAELKDKLRAIIIGMGIQAGDMTGVQNKINIQIYILTDFWESIKDANPVIFTFLRDGIPFYDRGIFMPWKQLLQMGRIKPSPEAIDMFMQAGDQMLERVRYKLREIGIEDFFWATVSTSQAALMLYGLPPPTPKETPELLRHIFVKKEKMFEDKYVKVVEEVLKVRKDMEHGTKKDITGKEVDVLYNDTKEFLERMKKLFEEIEQLKEKEEMNKSYEETLQVVKNALLTEGVTDIKDSTLIDSVKKNLVDKGKTSSHLYNELKELSQAKKDFDTGKLTKAEANKAIKTARAVMRLLIEHIQRVKTRELEKAKIRVKAGKKFGEIIIMKDKAFIIQDLEEQQKQVIKADITKEGELKNVTESTEHELEKALAESSPSERTFINEKLFTSIKKIFGQDAEIMMNY